MTALQIIHLDFRYNSQFDIFLLSNVSPSNLSVNRGGITQTRSGWRKESDADRSSFSPNSTLSGPLLHRGPLFFCFKEIFITHELITQRPHYWPTDSDHSVTHLLPEEEVLCYYGLQYLQTLFVSLNLKELVLIVTLANYLIYPS